MLRKIGKWVTITLFVSLALAAVAAPARGIFSNSQVKVGTELKYGVVGTECYVSWNFGIFMNVTYTNETHAFGNITDTSNDHVLLQNGANISLSIFVIRNVTDWNSRPNINNISTSQMLENWDTTHVNPADTGVYEDVTRNTVSINFTIQTTAPQPGAGVVSQNLKITWDNDTGVLVEYDLVQTHPSDQQFSGTWSITLAETTLWGISADVIPSYPLEILLLAVATGICGMLVSKKLRRSAN